MDILQEEWQRSMRIDQQTMPIFETSEIINAIHHKSKSHLAKLKKRAFHVFMWNLVLVVPFLCLVFLAPENPDYLLIVAIIDIFMVAMLGLTYYRYRIIQKDPDFSSPVLPILKYHYRTIRRTLQIENISTLIFFPISVIIGMCMALTLEGNSLGEIFSDQKNLIFMLTFSAILTPLGYWLALKMNNYLFGGLLKRLKEDIEKLEL